MSSILMRVDTVNKVLLDAPARISRGGPRPLTLSFLANGVQSLFPEGTQIVLEVFAPGDLETPVAGGTVSLWSRQDTAETYSANLNTGGAILGNLSVRTLYGRIRWTEPGEDEQETDLFHILYSKSSVLGENKSIPWARITDVPDVLQIGQNVIDLADQIAEDAEDAETAATDAADSAQAASDSATAAQSAAETAADDAAQDAIDQINSFGEALSYQDTWDASGNTAPADPEQGQFWIISAAGNFGSIAWVAGDAALWNGTVWHKVELETLLEEVRGYAVQQAAIAAQSKGNALVLRDTGYAEVPDRASVRPGLNSLFISFLFKATALKTNSGLVTKGRGLSTFPSGGTFGIFSSSGATSFLYREADGTSFVNSASFSTDGLPNFIGKWGHALIVRDVDNEVVRCYVNGVKVSEEAYTELDLDGTEPFRIGKASTVSELQNGDYKDVILGVGAPTGAEVLEISRNGLPYRFRQGSFQPEYTADWSSDADGWKITAGSDTTVTGNNDGISDGTTSKDNCLAVNRVSGGAGATVIGAGAGTINRISRINEIACWIYVPTGTFTQSTVYFSSSTINNDRVPVAEGEWTFVKFRDPSVLGETFNDQMRLQPALAATGSGLASCNEGETWYVAEFTQRRLGAVIHLSSESLGMEPGIWSDVSGNSNPALLSTSGAYSAKRLDEYTIEVARADIGTSAYVLRAGDILQDGYDVVQVVIINHDSVDAEDITCLYSDGSTTQEFIAASTIADGAPPAIRTPTVGKPDGLNRILITASSAASDLSILFTVRRRPSMS